MHLAHYLGLLHKAEDTLARAFGEVAAAHGDEPDVSRECERMAHECAGHVDKLRPFVDRYGEDPPTNPTSSTRTCSKGPAAAASACCGTCTTST